jgi:hypothetical protein
VEVRLRKGGSYKKFSASIAWNRSFWERHKKPKTIKKKFIKNSQKFLFPRSFTKKQRTKG